MIALGRLSKFPLFFTSTLRPAPASRAPSAFRDYVARLHRREQAPFLAVLSVKTTKITRRFTVGRVALTPDLSKRELCVPRHFHYPHTRCDVIADKALALGFTLPTPRGPAFVPIAALSPLPKGMGALVGAKKGALRIEDLLQALGLEARLDERDGATRVSVRLEYGELVALVNHELRVLETNACIDMEGLTLPELLVFALEERLYLYPPESV